MGFDGAFVGETRLFVSAEMIVHVVRCGCGLVRVSGEAVDFGSVGVIGHGHSLFLWRLDAENRGEGMEEGGGGKQRRHIFRWAPWVCGRVA